MRFYKRICPKVALAGGSIATVALLASSGVINVISTNQVSHELVNNQPVSGYRWEPSTASGSNWVTAWATYPSGNTLAGVTSYLSAWNGSNWQQPSFRLNTPNGLNTVDTNVAWDSARSRFVFTLIDAGLSVWYGHSTDSSGTQWVFGNADVSNNPQPVFSVGISATWDYPSIGVDSSGRVIIGAV